MADLKLLTARTLKWNAIDRVSSQILYALVGIVLANILSQEEFGLVGALAIFQAFATIFVDSGFGAALLREKEPTDDDYSTVFWFNTAVSLAIYALLFLSAPLIADLFQHQESLIPMSKVMFLTFVINGLAIVQTNRLMKQMNVRLIAISNSLALIIAVIIGVTLALLDFGAWAMVWYAVAQASVKTIILWATSSWHPQLRFSLQSLRKIRAVGFSVLSSALLNTISLNIYNFVIGVWYNLSSLGIYTQADKWSKMGSASISQILTSSFVPLLSKVQDSAADFRRYLDRAGRFTAFILMPAMIMLTIMASPIFHLLFANKWDAAIPLFQLLTLRGIFIVLISLYSNYLLSLGRARALFISEAIKDSLILAAILSTAWTADLDILIAGQCLASLLTWGLLLHITARNTSTSISTHLRHLLPFLSAATLSAIAAIAATILLAYATAPLLADTLPTSSPALALLSYNHPQPTDTPLRLTINLLTLLTQSTAFLATYLLILKRLKAPELTESLTYLLGRFRKK